jgi:hypothetical protein
MISIHVAEMERQLVLEMIHRGTINVFEKDNYYIMKTIRLMVLRHVLLNALFVHFDEYTDDSKIYPEIVNEEPSKFRMQIDSFLVSPC